MFALVATGCTSTPHLSEVTGTSDSPVFIRDVVQRVKCEVSDAFGPKLQDPKYAWLSSWTAHIDLTLQVNENSGISPSGSYTRFQTNAVNFDAGPSTFPAAAARAVVNQFLTVSAGATLSGQAVRTETVSFTLALDELRMWRALVDSEERDPRRPKESRICNPDPDRGLKGNLGLEEWVESALHPIDIRQLKAGSHPATGAKVPSPSTPAPGKSGPSNASRMTIRHFRKHWDFVNSLAVHQAMVVAPSDMTKQLAATRTNLEAFRRSAQPYKQLVEQYLIANYVKAKRLLEAYSSDVAKCFLINTELQAKIKSAQSSVGQILSLLNAEPDDLTYISQLEEYGLEKNHM